MDLTRLKLIGEIAKSAALYVKTAAVSVSKTVGTAVVENKGVRRALVLWAACLITWVTYQIFKGDLGAITTAVVAAYTVVTGVLGVVIGFYQTGRNKDDAAGVP